MNSSGKPPKKKRKFHGVFDKGTRWNDNALPARPVFRAAELPSDLSGDPEIVEICRRVATGEMVDFRACKDPSSWVAAVAALAMNRVKKQGRDSIWALRLALLCQEKMIEWSKNGNERKLEPFLRKIEIVTRDGEG